MSGGTSRGKGLHFTLCQTCDECRAVIEWEDKAPTWSEDERRRRFASCPVCGARVYLHREEKLTADELQLWFLQMRDYGMLLRNLVAQAEGRVGSEDRQFQQQASQAIESWDVMLERYGKNWRRPDNPPTN